MWLDLPLLLHESGKCGKCVDRLEEKFDSLMDRLIGVMENLVSLIDGQSVASVFE